MDLLTVEQSVRVSGVRELACRLNGDGKNFDKAAANPARSAQVQLSGETLRVLVASSSQPAPAGCYPLDSSGAA
jgi:hypothetical protein